MVQVLFFDLTKKVKNKKVGYRRNLTVLSCFYLLAFYEMAKLLNIASSSPHFLLSPCDKEPVAEIKICRGEEIQTSAADIYHFFLGLL